MIPVSVDELTVSMVSTALCMVYVPSLKVDNVSEIIEVVISKIALAMQST